MIDQHWDEFMTWNDAIAQVCFPDVDYPEPVYLDLDDDAKAALTELVQPEGPFEDALATAVRNVLVLDRGPGHVFRELEEEVAGWRGARRMESPPPILPFLASLSLAAQSMGAGDGLRPTNFYGRLLDLLGLHENKEEIQAAYRDIAEPFWNVLNRWLDSLDGRKGTPTAYQVGAHRYVGIPLSQALIRRVERQQMLRFFADVGLPAGANVADVELERLFQFWVNADPSPSPALARLWAQAALKPRVLEALKLSLRQWDGRAAVTSTDSDARGRTKLTLEYSSFLRRELTLGLLVYLDSAQQPRRARLTSQADEPEVDLYPAIPGALVVGDGLDNGDLLEAPVALLDSLTEQRAERLPTRLVLFRHDEASSIWIETEGVVTGETLRIACRADLLPSLLEVLEAAARPGWSALPDSIAGVPEGWAILRDVQIFNRLPDNLPKRADELSRLEPIVTSSLALFGGIKLPGIRSGWHRAALPEVRALAPTSPGFVVQLWDCFEEGADLLDEWTDDGTGQLVADLNVQSLDAGVYRLDLLLPGSDSPAMQESFSIHDGSSPLGRESSALVHNLDDPLSTLGVFRNEADETPNWHEGLESAKSDLGLYPDQAPAEDVWWTAAPPHEGARKERVRLTTADPNSCIFTGAHHWDIDAVDVDSWGRPRGSSKTRGRCSRCGVEKIYSNSYYKNRRVFLRGGAYPTNKRTHNGRALPQVNPPQDTIPWDTFVDALAWLGGGTWSEFMTILRQVDGSGPVMFHVAHTLEALGFIEIDRDHATFDPVAWTFTQPAIVDGANYSYLAGYWNKTQRGHFSKSTGSRLKPVQGDGPKLWRILTKPETIPSDYLHVADSWLDLAQELPSMSAIVENLPRRPLIHSGSHQWFHVPSAKWVEAQSLSNLGAYRSRSYTVVDWLRTTEDLERGTAAVSQVRLSKHAAAFMTYGKSLLAYDRSTQRLTVPLGADLPGLFNRAVVLAAGKLPHREGRQLVYDLVPSDLAHHIHYLLTH